MALLWNPLVEMEALRQEIDRAFQDFGVGGERFSPFFRALSTRTRVFPLLKVHEDRDNLYIEALAPGLNPETLEITVVNNALRISGEKQPITEEVKPEDYHRNERISGKFSRTLSLPVEVNSDKITAEYHEGLLKITAPKAEAAKPKQITVNVQ
ncbi:MAG: Hsp20/alpha crystallin family protein [Clostridiaceae bacterium]